MLFMLRHGKPLKVAKLVAVRALFILFVAGYTVLGAVCIRYIEMRGQSGSVPPNPNFNGTSLNHGMQEERKKWTWESTILFTFSTITTIGYGHIAPTTPLGRTFVMFFAVLGIPLTMMMLADMGKFYAELLRQFYKRGCSACRKVVPRVLSKVFGSNGTLRMKPNEASSDSTSTENPKILIVITYLIWLALGGLLLPLYENLDIFSSIYFAFVSISTIGFGDISPKNYRFFPITVIYILIGLAIMTMLIECMAEYFRKLHFFGRSISNLNETVIWFGGKPMSVQDVIGGVLRQMNLDDKKIQELSDPGNLDGIIRKMVEESEPERRESRFRKSDRNSSKTKKRKKGRRSVFDPTLPHLKYIDSDRKSGSMDGTSGSESQSEDFEDRVATPVQEEDGRSIYVEYTLPIPLHDAELDNQTYSNETPLLSGATSKV